MHALWYEKFNDLEGAFAQLVRGKVKQLEIGQRLPWKSFDLMQLLQPTPQSAARTSSTEGEALFLTRVSRGCRWARLPCTVSFDGEKDIDLRALKRRTKNEPRPLLVVTVGR